MCLIKASDRGQSDFMARFVMHCRELLLSFMLLGSYSSKRRGFCILDLQHSTDPDTLMYILFFLIASLTFTCPSAAKIDIYLADTFVPGDVLVTIREQSQLGSLEQWG